jgi:hypothetical protein
MEIRPGDDRRSRRWGWLVGRLSVAGPEELFDGLSVSSPPSAIIDLPAPIVVGCASPAAE